MRLRRLLIRHITLPTTVHRFPNCTLRQTSCNGVRNGSRSYASVSAAELQFGQPLHETHPHLLKAGEVTPGISAVEYALRRSKLAARLPNNAIAIIAASDTKYRSGAVFYEFHQHPDFFYLTGFNEPEALAIIQKTGDDSTSPSGGEHIFHLFVRPKDSKAEQWEGARSGMQAAQDVFNADQVGNVNELEKFLPSAISNASEVYTDISGRNRGRTMFSKLFSGPPTKLEGFPKMVETASVKPLRPIMNELRVVKSADEIANMRLAGKASGRAFTLAMGQNFTKEKHLAAFLDYQFRMYGCDTNAYVPVVAGGDKALSIHYVRNDDVLRDGQLVLVDAGGEYGGYISDITRTWPINGKFSEPQRDLYEAILTVQRKCITLCSESADVTLDKLHNLAEEALKEQLTQLGFNLSGGAMETLFPHHVGHYIGLDVHDAPGYPRTSKLKAGQCVTIEPGLYIPNDERWPQHFRGIGIRIEDSVCVQSEGPLVLTTEAVKEVVDIEALSDR
ncbi:MAG: hypothetical protein M1835_006278 [Candelina submexicana]|nr:MAG: hypothetical protein M1835_006278 [Candelina submexicana]